MAPSWWSSWGSYGNTVLIGSAVYFKCRFGSSGRAAILKLDLLTQETSTVQIPSDGALQKDLKNEAAVLMTMDGKLGFAFTVFTFEVNKLYVWLREHGPDEDARWAQSIVMDLDKLLQTELIFTHAVSCADNGAGGGVVFIWSRHRLFSIDLKSGSSKVVGERIGLCRTVPYVSFGTPAALGAICIEEGPGADDPVHRRSPNYNFPRSSNKEGNY